MYRQILIVSLLSLSTTPSWPEPDPMRPVILPEAVVTANQPIDASQWRLSLIRQSGESRVALLNGRLLKVGGCIDGAQVTAIEEDKVTLRLADKRSVKLLLPSAELRKNKD